MTTATDLDRLTRARYHARLRSVLSRLDAEDQERLDRLAALPDLSTASDGDFGWLCRVVLLPGHLSQVHARAQELSAFAQTRRALGRAS